MEEALLAPRVGVEGKLDREDAGKVWLQGVSAHRTLGAATR